MHRKGAGLRTGEAMEPGGTIAPNVVAISDDHHSAMTHAGMFSASAAYMSPEQAKVFRPTIGATFFRSAVCSTRR